MKPRFSKVKQMAVNGTATVRFRLAQLVGSPELEVRPATQVNPDFLNLALADATASSGRRIVSKADIDRARNEDRVTFSKVVVKGWHDVMDDDGNAVPFSEEACLEFLQALPDDIFDALRSFCTNNDNFRRMAETEKMAKNSGPG